MTTDGAAHYYTTSIQGAPSTVTSPTGTVENTADYGPTGTVRPGATTTVAQPFGYTGAYLDTSGLYKMGARSYDRTTNRFTQVDPSGKETNAYLYAAGDPINRMDPTGTSNSALEYVNFALGAIGMVAGVVGLIATSPVIVGVAAGVGAAIGIALFVEGAACLFSENC
ncbi:RHS repeat-associated core domain-containing protein [Streptomyces sp. NPDC008150]|uniref:RHS repeat-associated core domain-containing protein n=1 Tax=Streptomyces sp. NPDC008150 TaxID=3364816 RepID=UPI0036E0032A